MTHPLTEKDCFNIQWDDSANYQDEVDLMRAAYDLAIQHSIKWMEENLGLSCYQESIGYYETRLDVEFVVSDFRDEIYATMNPSTQEEDQ